MSGQSRTIEIVYLGQTPGIERNAHKVRRADDRRAKVQFVPTSKSTIGDVVGFTVAKEEIRKLTAPEWLLKKKGLVADADDATGRLF